MAEKKNLAKLSKKGTTNKKTNNTSKSTSTASKTKATANKSSTVKKATANKTSTKKAETKPVNPAEERDLKAKQKVEELLKDVKLTDKGEDDLLVVDNQGDTKSAEWLQEQTSLLSKEVERLRVELAEAKELNKKNENSGGNDQLKNTVIRLFNELQDNHIRAGYDQYGNPNFIIRPIAFMNRMVMFFPFLEDVKKF